MAAKFKTRETRREKAGAKVGAKSKALRAPGPGGARATSTPLVRLRDSDFWLFQKLRLTRVHTFGPSRDRKQKTRRQEEDAGDKTGTKFRETNRETNGGTKNPAVLRLLN